MIEGQNIKFIKFYKEPSGREFQCKIDGVIKKIYYNKDNTISSVDVECESDTVYHKKQIVRTSPIFISEK